VLDQEDAISEGSSDAALLARVEARPARVVVPDLDLSRDRLELADPRARELRLIGGEVVRIGSLRHRRAA
jgi:hypothetical protein